MGSPRFATPMTVLCGDNGSGKPSLLSILASRLWAVRSGQEIIKRERLIDRAQGCFPLHKLPCRHTFLFMECPARMFRK